MAVLYPSFHPAASWHRGRFMRDGGVGTTRGEECAPAEDYTNVFFLPVFETPAALRDPFNLRGSGKPGG